MESLGPWAETQRGKMHDAFNSSNFFILYTLQYGQDPPSGSYHTPELYYQCWAHKTNPQHQLYYSGVKIDKLFTSRHKQALKDYYAVRGAMGQRFLQADGGAVLWHSAPDQHSRLLTIWNFHLRKSAPLSGCSVLYDVTANGTVVPAQPAGSERFDLKPWHTYQCVCGGEAPCATHL